MPSSDRRTWASVHLDLIRGLAALVVVAGHARSLFFNGLTAEAPSQSDGGPFFVPAGTGVIPMTIGREAVMVFFVLSGFLVGGSVLRQIASGTWAWRDYIIKRLARLWVVLIPVMFIGVAVDVLGRAYFAGPGSLYSAPDGQGYVNPWTFASGLSWRTLMGNIVFLQDIFVPMPGTNLALWSLANEFWYYMAFPALVIALSARFSVIQRALFAMLCLAILVMVGIHTSFLFLIWIFGATVAVLPCWFPKILTVTISVVTGICFVTIFLFIKNIVHGSYASELIIGLSFSIFLYAIKFNIAKEIGVFYEKISSYLSNISYTLYVSHLPVMVFMTNIYNSPWERHPLSFLYFSEFISVIVVSIAWATVLYRLFEARTDTVRRFAQRALFGRSTALPHEPRL